MKIKVLTMTLLGSLLFCSSQSVVLANEGLIQLEQQQKQNAGEVFVPTQGGDRRVNQRQQIFTPIMVAKKKLCSDGTTNPFDYTKRTEQECIDKIATSGTLTLDKKHRTGFWGSKKITVAI